MAGFYFPRDPYFPDEGNKVWLDEELEEDPEEGQEEDEEMEEGDSDTESEVSDPHIPVRDRHAPLPEPSYQDPTPVWAERLNQWSREQGLRPPYGMCRDFFDVNEGGAANRALPVTIGRIDRQEGQIRATTSQILDVGAATEVATARVRRIDEAHHRTSERVDSLEEDGRTTMGMFREAFVRISESEQRIRDIEQRAEEAVREAADLRAQVAALRGDRRSSSS